MATALGQTALGDPVYRNWLKGDQWGSEQDLENRWKRSTDIDKGTSDDTMNGYLNELLVASVLWDLMDPDGDVILDGHDEISESYGATLGSFSRYVPMEGREDRGPAGPDFVDCLDGWRCYTWDVPDSKLEALLKERKFPYDFVTGLCRH